MIRVFEYVGLVLFMIGACGMDSENQLIPAVMTLVGGAMIYITSRLDKNPDMD